LFYFRMLPDGRFLFGSRGGLRGTPAAASAMRGWMTARLHAQFPEWRDIAISHSWRGLVCLTRDLVAHVGQLADQPSVYYALGYHGTGVAMAGWCGRAMARLIAGAERATDLPAPLAAPLLRYPVPRLRRLYLAAAYGGFKIADGWR
jgi:glycine/D-amino acid oxidase-like deaminating enzyme